jgi:signal-transduction protein with cAMP-binding, CBS, and nucleotidyltransferase domain
MLFRAVAGDHMGARPAEITRTASIDEVARLVAGAGAVIVNDSSRRPAGIITARDMLQRVMRPAAPAQAVEQVMTSPVITVAVGDRLLDAITIMRRHRLSRVPVVDETGRLVGMLGLQDALLSLIGCTRRLVDELVPDAGLETLQRVKASELEIVRQLLDEDTPAIAAMALLTDINLELHRRALALAIHGLAADGWGAPPVAFSLVVMGAAGRGECLLAPDQDNGFILADYEDNEHGRIDSYFVPLAVRFTRLLAEIGFPVCVGNVMATNPVWRKRISQWREQIAIWLRKRTETQLLLSDILVDFRHVAGDAELSAALRRHITQAIAESPTFVRDLFEIEAHHEAALGWLGGLRSERDTHDRPGMINLKLRGTLPLVEAARLLSLREGLPETSTLARLDGLLAAGVLHADDHDNLKDAFALICSLLLRQQVEDAAAGREIGDFVPEECLSRREKDRLVTSLRSIVNVRKTLAADLGRRP